MLYKPDRTFGVSRSRRDLELKAVTPWIHINLTSCAVTMCGRSACTMGPDDVRKACGYRGNHPRNRRGNQGGGGGTRGGNGAGNRGGNRGGARGGGGGSTRAANPTGNQTRQTGGNQDESRKAVLPRWIDPPGGETYQPSHNVCPGTHTPILISKTHVDYEKARSGKGETETMMETNAQVETETETETECPWVIQPMRWGLIPSWHSGDSAKGVGYNMINARSDGIMTKRTFKGPLEKGRRCVVLVDGYFEWQTKDGQKQPYFLYFPSNTESSEKSTQGGEDQQMEAETERVEKEQAEAGGKEQTEADGKQPGTEASGNKRLLTMAGLFDIWRPKNGSPPVYSYSIITVDACPSLKWLHHRMPAILNGEDEVEAWLNAGEVPLTKAVNELIRPVAAVTHHPVSTAVNNNKNKGEDCTKPIDLEKIKKKEKASSNLMSSWLSKGKRKSTDDVKDVAKDEGVSAEKKFKVDADVLADAEVK